MNADAVTVIAGAGAPGGVGSRGPWPRRIAGAVATLFGLATIVEGGHVLFGGPAARAAAGHVVGFVLIFNFAAGFGYVATGVAAALGRGWAATAARGLAAATLVVFAGFGVHVAAGGAFEPRTVVAMTLRAGFWVVQAWLLGRWLGRDRRAVRVR